MNRDDIQTDDVDDDVRKALAELKGEVVENDNDDAVVGDLTVAPAGETDDERVVREEKIARDASGRFAKKSGDTTKQKESNEDATASALAGKDGAGGADSTAAKLDDQSQPQTGAPPPSWSIKSKAAWDALPADVRADIVKRENEVAQGFAALQDYKDLKPFAEMAKQHGTTISGALTHFINMEQVIRKDIGQGLALIAQNSGLNQQQAAQIFATLAQKFGGAPAAAPGAASPQQGDPLQELLQPLLQPLMQEIGSLKGSLTQREQLEQQRQMQTQAQAIEQFAADPAHRYFNELEGTMTQLLQSGLVPRTGNAVTDLKAAYEMAARMNPEVSQALIDQRLATEGEAKRRKEQEAAARAKAASRSMSGSRVPGTVIRNEDRSEHSNLDDDIEADVRSAYRSLSMA